MLVVSTSKHENADVLMRLAVFFIARNITKSLKSAQCSKVHTGDLLVIIIIEYIIFILAI